jgi:hypothetical protein
MTLHVSRSEVYQALSQVRHPEIQSRNLVALGMILEVTGERAWVVGRSTLWPFWPGALPLPWGGLIGMAMKI